MWHTVKGLVIKIQYQDMMPIFVGRDFNVIYSQGSCYQNTIYSWRNLPHWNDNQCCTAPISRKGTLVWFTVKGLVIKMEYVAENLFQAVIAINISGKGLWGDIVKGLVIKIQYMAENRFQARILINFVLLHQDMMPNFKGRDFDVIYSQKTCYQNTIYGWNLFQAGIPIKFVLLHQDVMPNFKIRDFDMICSQGTCCKNTI